MFFTTKEEWMALFIMFPVCVIIGVLTAKFGAGISFAKIKRRVGLELLAIAVISWLAIGVMVIIN